VVTAVITEETAVEPIEMPFCAGGVSRGPKKHVLDVDACGRHLANTTQQSVCGGDAGCRFVHHCRSFFSIYQSTTVVTLDKPDDDSYNDVGSICSRRRGIA